ELKCTWGADRLILIIPTRLPFFDPPQGVFCCLSWKGGGHAQQSRANRFYACGAFGCNCDYRSADWITATGRSSGARGGAAEPVPEQFETNGAGATVVSRRQQAAATGAQSVRSICGVVGVLYFAVPGRERDVHCASGDSPR